jgi:hypothetical protein
MTISKLRIDLSNGQLEIEGDKDLVRAVYEDFKDQVARISSAPNKPHYTSRAKAMRPPVSKRAAHSDGTSVPKKRGRKPSVGTSVPKKRGRKPLSRNGAKRRSWADSRVMREEMKAARKMGISAAELAEKYGVSMSYVYQQK